MSGTNWVVIIGVVLLLVIGVWYYTGSTGDGGGTMEPVAESPAIAPADAPADAAADTATEAPAAN